MIFPCFLVCLVFLNAVHGLQVLDKNFWKNKAIEDLKASLHVRPNTRDAKNVIIFIGDGMDPNTITAARIYMGGESSYVTWERFPHMGAIKTYAADKQVPDSANTATALFTGIKGNYGMLSIDPSVMLNDCDKSLLEENHLISVAQLAQDAGKSTGIVTTTSITDATPAAMYSHSANRDWQCESVIPQEAQRCKDIARQLIENIPGKKLNVIMGGGRQQLKANTSSLPGDPIEGEDCTRKDGRDLIKEWANQKQSLGLNYAVSTNTKTLLEVDTDKTDYLLGIYSNSHLPYNYIRDKSENGVPSLEQMTTTALKILMKNKKGFLLMVEGGRIDHAHHAGKAHVALDEVAEMNKAINSTINLLESAGMKDDTLIIVTSDHAHTLTISGYPERGNDILGIAGVSPIDGLPYTTLGYANGGKDNYHYKVVDGKVAREDPSKVDTTSYEYGAQAAVLLDIESHGGNDVFVYATGPYAHLFHHLHEQNYVAEVIKYASKIGEYSLPRDGTSKWGRIF